ncbi:MAG: hypothetical protein ACOYEQ_08295 [Bacillota bacterium]|jgi:hypothetical protein
MTCPVAPREEDKIREASSCQADLNLLRPDILGLLEERERKAFLIRLVFIGAALVIWVMVALRAWEIGVIISERRCDELEMGRVSQEIEKVTAQLSVVSPGVREAREEIANQVNWANRLSKIRSLVPEGCILGTFNVRKDATVQLSGLAQEPSCYAQVLDAVGNAEFVTGVKSASLISSKQGGYEFLIVIATRPTD